MPAPATAGEGVGAARKRAPKKEKEKEKPSKAEREDAVKAELERVASHTVTKDQVKPARRDSWLKHPAHKADMDRQEEKLKAKVKQDLKATLLKNKAPPADDGPDPGLFTPVKAQNPELPPPGAGSKAPHRHRRNKTFIMNKKSIPELGKFYYTPWNDARTLKCCRHLGKVNQKLVDALPAHDVLHENMYKTCAVVGSGGILLSQEFGRAIDEHDAVFRFNIAPARGFEPFVGSKTTIRLVNRLHAGFRESKSEITIQHTTLAPTLSKYVNSVRRHPDLKNYAFDMAFYKRTLDKKLQQPTNGFFGMNLALELCEDVSIYGFLRTWKGWFKYHYFNSEEPNKKQLERDIGGEMPFIKRLLLKHKERLHFVHPCIIDSECKGCKVGSHCNGKAPYAVPRPGWCVVELTTCFKKCPDGVACPGGHGKPGRCPASLARGGC